MNLYDSQGNRVIAFSSHDPRIVEVGKMIDEKLSQVGGDGVRSFETLADLQAALPSGIAQPVWVVSEKSWYHWAGETTTPPVDTTAPTVSASPNGGTFSATQQVTLSANETATIYYTTNGSTPTEASQVYSSPITLSDTATLKFFAKDTAGNSSSVQSVTFTKQAPPVDTTAPTLTITPANTFTETQQVTMSTNEAATIYYTLDGSTPTTSSSVYSSALTITETKTLKAFARDTAGNSSAVQTVVYTKEAGGTAPGTVLISDTFNRADSTSLGSTNTGQAWTTYTNANGTVTYGVRNNQFYYSGGTWTGAVAKQRRQATVTVPSNNFTLETKLAIQTAANSAAIGLRYAGDGNSLFLTMQLNGTAGQRYIIHKLPNGGSLTVLATGTRVPSNGDLIKIDHYSDGKIDVFINGTLEVTATDTMNLAASTVVGLGIEADVATFDDFKITAL